VAGRYSRREIERPILYTYVGHATDDGNSFRAQNSTEKVADHTCVNLENVILVIGRATKYQIIVFRIRVSKKNIRFRIAERPNLREIRLDRRRSLLHDRDIYTVRGGAGA